MSSASPEVLRTTLEDLRQAAEQYLDTEHRSPERDAELRRRLGDASLYAALILNPIDPVPAHTA